MNKKILRWVILVVIVGIFASLAIGCSAGNNEKQKQKMVEALDGFVKINTGNDTAWMFLADGTYLQRNMITESESTGTWEIVSVSGNAMRIQVGSWGVYEVVYNVSGGKYSVVSIESVA